MSDRTAEFFDGLNRRGHVPALHAVTATLRFDLEHDHGVDHWFMTISNGDVHVSRGTGDTDTDTDTDAAQLAAAAPDQRSTAVLRTSKELFDRVVTGEASAFAAWVRNEYLVSGEVRLARLFQRLLPGRPGAHHPREFARARRQRA